MNIIETLSGPLIGALIGYGTNYIAVKMLFRPLHPIKIGKYTLPFTPGIIPKGKDRIALALGSAVGGTLFTKEDIETTLLAEDTKKAIVDDLMNGIRQLSKSENTIKQVSGSYLSDQDYESMKMNMESFISNKLLDGMEKLHLGSLIAEEGGKAIKEKTQGTMFAMFVNDKLIASIADPIGEKVNEYIMGEGKEKIESLISKEIEDLEQKSVHEILEDLSNNKATQLSINRETVRGIIEKVYMDIIHDKAELFIKQIDIAKVVEDKVKAMDVMELEELVLSVMKKELNDIVSLGAIIGFTIGLLNLLF